MDLKLRDVARLLDLPESTVRRWAKSGKLPSAHVDDEYLFNRVELQEWAVANHRRIAPTLGTISVRAALELGEITYDLPGTTPREALEAVSRLPSIPAGVDRGRLAELLVSREAMASTGIGGGIALPHPRDPVVIAVDDGAPRIILALLARPIDFHAIDGQPVTALFTLLSPSIQVHLQVLSRLAFMLHDAQLTALLGAAAPREAILERVGQLERP